MGLRHRVYLELGEAILTDLPDVMKIVDTSDPKANNDYYLGSAASTKGDKIIAWHVTDDVSGVKRAIKGGTSFRKTYGPKGAMAELGPGLYVSGAPQLWMGRSRSKWGFLKKMSSSETTKLCDVLMVEIDKLQGQRYISDSEASYAKRDIGLVKDGTLDSGVLISIAGQPFNIAFWKEDFLSKVGLRTAKEPEVFKVLLKGKFAQLAGVHVSAATYRVLRRGGIDGVFVKASMADVPQLAVWNPKSVKSIVLDRSWDGS